MAPKSAAALSKRKRTSNAEKPTKRRRSLSQEEEAEEDASDKILEMEQSILESKKNYNNIPILLQTMGGYLEGKEDEGMLATVALCRVFMRLLAQGSFVHKKSQSEKDSVVVGWLKEQLGAYKNGLLSMLESEEVAGTAVTLAMRLLKAEGEHMYEKEEYTFPTNFLQSIIVSLLQADNDDVRGVFMEEYAEKYDDIRYYTFKSLKSAIEGSVQGVSESELFDRVFNFISGLDGVPESSEELEDFYVPRPKKKTHNLRSVTQHKKQGQEVWLALIGIAQSKEQRKRILDVMSTVVAPWFTKPELLADFLTNLYNSGGSMSLLALSGVFYLISERNLDYPSFYHKLYSLLDRNILHSKHRSRFFRLLDTFLASTHLPAALVASFIKRLSRLSLNAPPSAVVFVVPWIYNQLRRHPSCTFMVHRETRDPEIKKQIRNEGVEDPFLPEETDPMETMALDSSLWEIEQLQSHYHPNVATIAKILSEQFTKQTYNMEDFLDHTYATLLDAEMTKNVRKAPVVEFHIPKRIFLPQDEPMVNPDSLLVKLWGF